MNITRMFDEILRVPLIIKWPRGERAGAVNAVPASGVDIAPTLLAHAGLETADLPGDHLHHEGSGGPDIRRDLLQAVVSGGFKGIFGIGTAPDGFSICSRIPTNSWIWPEQRLDTLQKLEELLAGKKREAEALYRSFGPQGDPGGSTLSREGAGTARGLRLPPGEPAGGYSR